MPNQRWPNLPKRTGLDNGQVKKKYVQQQDPPKPWQNTVAGADQQTWAESLKKCTWQPSLKMFFLLGVFTYLGIEIALTKMELFFRGI